MDTGLAGKVVVVTGATANIGRGIALAFAEEGARIVVVGRDEQAGLRVAERAREQGAADALWHAADVTVEDRVGGLVEAVLARFGRIDVLVNNVGGSGDFGPFVSTTPAQWRADLDMTVLSTLLCTHAVLPHMLEQGSGSIVNIGSMAAIIGDPQLAVYSAAKGAVHSFTRVLALELGKTGITVNAVAPYGTRPRDPQEEFSAGSRYHPESGLFSRALRERPDQLHTIGRPTALPRQQAYSDEIGAAAVYLASEQAAFVTGQVLQVDGGVALV
ncbi:SDR family oxidoreductase [Nocardia sp. CA2R105]|uniref:SDR family NAD(P)-dependent oxidoreductase n=1 Tax=Nocardia coffeae TaxID=2873381 RepID=UPI001CA60FF0|nr:SDR family NAD(P)-dependent oxidoreductase [Nocardia coffeae]MBY8860959.1 SDR family oxidoreductase [Nocardia coffeae]